MLYIFAKVLNRQIFWYQNVDWLYRKPRQNSFANAVGIKCLSNHTPHHMYNYVKKSLKMGVYCEYPADGYLSMRFIYTDINTLPRNKI